MSLKSYLIAIGAAVAALIVIKTEYDMIQSLRAERDKYQSNTHALLSDVEQYKVADSLNAATIQSLRLTMSEFERFRAEDAALIRQLRSKNLDLAAVNKSQSQTIIDLRAMPRDTVIIIDSVSVPAVAVHCGDAWYDFDGILTDKSFDGKLESRDSLIIAEKVKYKRFLGFLWKTSRVKERRIDCVSRNPHTKILDVEHVIIEK